MSKETIIRKEQRKLEREYGGIIYTWRQSSYESDGSGATYDYTIVERGYACGRRESRNHRHSGQCGNNIIKSGSIYVSFY